MEENSSSQMGRFRSQWLLEIRFPCRDSEDSSDYSITREFIKEAFPSYAWYVAKNWGFVWILQYVLLENYQALLWWIF